MNSGRGRIRSSSGCPHGDLLVTGPVFDRKPNPAAKSRAESISLPTRQIAGEKTTEWPSKRGPITKIIIDDDFAEILFDISTRPVLSNLHSSIIERKDSRRFSKRAGYIDRDLIASKTRCARALSVVPRSRELELYCVGRRNRAACARSSDGSSTSSAKASVSNIVSGSAQAQS